MSPELSMNFNHIHSDECVTWIGSPLNTYYKCSKTTPQSVVELLPAGYRLLRKNGVPYKVINASSFNKQFKEYKKLHSNCLIDNKKRLLSQFQNYERCSECKEF